MSKAAMASQFQNGLNPKYKGQVRVQRLKTLRDMVDSARIIEQSYLEAQKDKDAKAKEREMTRPRTRCLLGKMLLNITNVEIGKSQNNNNSGGGQRDFQKKVWFDKDVCYNCGEKGHIRSNCTKFAQALQ